MKLTFKPSPHRNMVTTKSSPCEFVLTKQLVDFIYSEHKHTAPTFGFHAESPLQHRHMVYMFLCLLSSTNLYANKHISKEDEVPSFWYTIFTNFYNQLLDQTGNFAKFDSAPALCDLLLNSDPEHSQVVIMEHLLTNFYCLDNAKKRNMELVSISTSTLFGCTDELFEKFKSQNNLNSKLRIEEVLPTWSAYTNFFVVEDRPIRATTNKILSHKFSITPTLEYSDGFAVFLDDGVPLKKTIDSNLFSIFKSNTRVNSL